MQERSVVERIGILEQKVELLESLPGRMHAVELQILQLRGEMRDAFSALRAEFRTEIKASSDHLKSELRAEIRAGDEETRRYMRVLHEEVISRIATIGEGRKRRT